MPFVNGIKAARERIVARDDEDRTDFLRKRGFSKAETTKIIDTVLMEEGRRPRASSTSCRASRPFVEGIKAARARIVARSDEDRSDFLGSRGFSKAASATIIETVLKEEGRKPESVFDFVQGITAVARKKSHQDARLDWRVGPRRCSTARSRQGALQALISASPVVDPCGPFRGRGGPQAS